MPPAHASLHGSVAQRNGQAHTIGAGFPDLSGVLWLVVWKDGALAHLCSACAASSSSLLTPIMVCAVLRLMTAVSAMMAATAKATSESRLSASWNSLTAMSFSVPARGQIEAGRAAAGCC